MEIWQVAALGLVAGLFAVLLRSKRPEMALQLALAAGALIFLLVLSRVSSVIDVLQDLAVRAKVNGFYLITILRVIGVAYIAEFAGQVLRDAGEGAIASKVEMAGKVLVLVLAMPILVAILESVSNLLS